MNNGKCNFGQSIIYLKKKWVGEGFDGYLKRGGGALDRVGGPAREVLGIIGYNTF